ncbi:hypothetical protein SAMN04488063_0706 [Halopelagius inordinatus]|uniref:Uncharacterized protein n=1 Tax=Halopelagius inordinatus TaxID=553467 RepID=A0A1I2MFM3_9EURY|nr:hypothetical protein [Halopelagius inordinatus]SFF89788.1 hypothetical protein SAMN04488063_0706 [Halopelagius inordinatus]
MNATTADDRPNRPPKTRRFDVTDVTTGNVAEFARSRLGGMDVRFERRPGRTHLVAEADR